MGVGRGQTAELRPAGLNHRGEGEESGASDDGLDGSGENQERSGRRRGRLGRVSGFPLLPLRCCRHGDGEGAGEEEEVRGPARVGVGQLPVTGTERIRR